MFYAITGRVLKPCTPCCTERPCLGGLHWLIDALTLHLSFPRRGRGLHEATFDRMSFKFRATWGERYFTGLLWAGTPSFLPQHRRSLLGCHFQHSSSPVFLKTSKESQSDQIACHEVATSRIKALEGNDRSTERVLKVVLIFCLGL
jgi:hypothetical protein